MKPGNFTNNILHEFEMSNIRGGNDEPIKQPDTIVLMPPPPPYEQ